MHADPNVLQRQRKIYQKQDSPIDLTSGDYGKKLFHSKVTNESEKDDHGRKIDTECHGENNDDNPPWK